MKEVMNGKDIKGILWLLEEINKDKMIASYFRQELNGKGTDIARLINQFKDIVKIMNNPMYVLHDDVPVPLVPELIIRK